MAARDNDLLGAEAFGDNDTAQADGAVADDRHFLALAALPPRPHDGRSPSRLKA
jgi:hypothetical protein